MPQMPVSQTYATKPEPAPPRSLHYSQRSASFGSMRVARRAGRWLAARATAARKSDAAAKTSGSVALTCTSRLAASRVTASAATTPIATPNSVSRMPRRTTSARTSAGRAVAEANDCRNTADVCHATFVTLLASKTSDPQLVAAAESGRLEMLAYSVAGVHIVVATEHTTIA